MGIINLYQNLPGQLVEFKDGGSSLISEPVAENAKSILILGTAVDGPVNEPVQVSASTVAALYGSEVNANGLPNGTTLVKYAKQAFKCGFTDVRCMRVAGAPSGVAIGETLDTELMSITEQAEGFIYNGLTTEEISAVTKIVTGAAEAISYAVKSVRVNGETFSTRSVTVTGTGATTTIKPVANRLPAGVVVEVTLKDKAGASEDVVDSFTMPTSVTRDFTITLPEGAKYRSARVLKNGITVVSDATVEEALGVLTVAVNCDILELKDIITVTYTYDKVNEASGAKTFLLESTYGGARYNTCKVEVKRNALDGTVDVILTKPDEKKFTKGEAPLTFNSSAYPTYGLLAEAINNHSLNNVFRATTGDDDLLVVDMEAVAATSFTGGKDGIKLTKSELFDALSGTRDDLGYVVTQGAYQVLENYKVDYVYPAGVYANDYIDGKKDFHYELALFCAVLTYRTKMTHGLIDMKPNTNTTLIGIQKYVEKCNAYDVTKFMVNDKGDIIYDGENNPFDIGKFTSVCVGPDPIVVSDTLGSFYGSPAIAYSGLNASINPESAPTNKALLGCRGLKYKLSNKQMNELVGKRFVTFKYKEEGTTVGNSKPYVVDGCTAARPGSDYARLTTIKILTDVVDQIREVSDPFIGEPNTVEQRNALAALISKRLSYLKENGKILFYDFEISSSIEQQLVGEATIALTIACPQELRKITTVVSLKAAA